MELTVRENPVSPWVIGLAAAGTFAAGLLLARTAKAASADPLPTATKWPVVSPAEPVVVGSLSNPRVASAINAMRRQFEQAGIDTRWIDPVEVTRLQQAPGQPLAIPPERYWPRMIQTLRMGYMPLRRTWGRPIRILSGYRPPDYNVAIGGESNSRHMWFEGIDLAPADATAEDKRQFALLLASFWIANRKRLLMGLGIYGRQAPSGHIDTGYADRSWEDTEYWVERYQAVA